MINLLSSKKFQLGFTLIELIVVVAIIAIMVTIGAVSYTTVTRNARNAQRQTDLRQIAEALEEYYNDRHFYPTTNMNGHVPAQFETAGHFVTFDKIACLLGGSIASGMPVVFGQWSCTQTAAGNPIPGPYNVYLGSGVQSRIPHDPFKDYYAYASNGQTYVLVTQCYEGTAPSDYLFTTSNPYYNEAYKWSGNSNQTQSCRYPWTDQYFVTSPQDR